MKQRLKRLEGLTFNQLTRHFVVRTRLNNWRGKMELTYKIEQEAENTMYLFFGEKCLGEFIYIGSSQDYFRNLKFAFDNGLVIGANKIEAVKPAEVKVAAVESSASSGGWQADASLSGSSFCCPCCGLSDDDGCNC